MLDPLRRWKSVGLVLLVNFTVAPGVALGLAGAREDGSRRRAGRRPHPIAPATRGAGSVGGDRGDMTRIRAQRRAESERRILGAAWRLMAAVGPAGTSLRDVADEAGCTHTLVVRYHGSKDNLVTAVGERLATGVAATVERLAATHPEPAAALLAAARRHPTCRMLLVRSALGDLEPPGFPGCLHLERLSAGVRAGASGRPSARRRADLCAYAASSVLLGWVTFEPFLIAAARLGAVGPTRRERAVAAAAGRVLRLAGSSHPELRARPLPRRPTPRAPDSSAPAGSRAALLDSAIELFAAHGPGAVSVRDIARHAGVNQGLIHRHFGSKEALLAAAIEQGSATLVPLAWAAPTFDVDAVVQLVHRDPTAPRLIARALVDGIEITRVRRRFPVVRGLLDTFGHVPTGRGPGDLSDPRLVVAAVVSLVLGSAIWGPHLRAALGLSDRSGIEAAVADVVRWFLDGSPRG
jgi:AcrR family transcriptional regulator